MNPRVLITGASGLLGRYLIKSRPLKWNVCGTWLTTFLPDGYRMDITRQETVQNVFSKFQPDIVIHCAAIGSVDYCETHPEEAMETNVIGTDNVAYECLRYKAKFVFISSNAVFDGEHAPYVEHSLRQPVNVYGVLKSTSENLVHNYPYEWLIVRPILLYGWPYKGGRGNWVTRALDFMRNGHTLHVVDDTMTQPTYAMDCATAIWALLENEVSGTYHVAGMDRLSLYQFTGFVADVFGLNKMSAKPVKSDFFKDLAPRPKDTTYDLTKLWNLNIEAARPGGIIQGLRRMYVEPS